MYRIDVRDYAWADLGVTPGQLLAALGRLDPVLAPLGTESGSIDRGVFLSRYLETSCVLQQGGQTTPALCPSQP